MIWGALGNTTNLAARLQAMSRELEAAVVIDRPTFERGREAAASFVDQGELPIRGRSDPERVFASSAVARLTRVTRSRSRAEPEAGAGKAGWLGPRVRGPLPRARTAGGGRSIRDVGLDRFIT